MRAWIICRTQQIYGQDSALCHESIFGIVQNCQSAALLRQIQPFLTTHFKLRRFMCRFIGCRAAQIAILNVAIDYRSPNLGDCLRSKHIAGIPPVYMMGHINAGIMAVKQNCLMQLGFLKLISLLQYNKVSVVFCVRLFQRHISFRLFCCLCNLYLFCLPIPP